jgi:uncharacterized protein
MRYLLLIGLVLIILWFFRRPPNHRHRAYRHHARTARNSAARQPERMVRCVHCGVHLPESESFRDGANRHYCDEHRIAARNRED